MPVSLSREEGVLSNPFDEFRMIALCRKVQHLSVAINLFPSKQAGSEKGQLSQLTKDLNVLMAILAGIPSSQIIFHTLACFSDTSSYILCVC